MTVQFDSYKHETDYELVNTFLYRTYALKYPNWLQPRWEYFHYHPNTEEITYPLIGVYKEVDGRIVGLVTHEGDMGEAYIMVEKGYETLKLEMLDYAEKYFLGIDKEDNKFLYVYANEFDTVLLEELKKRNYKRYTEQHICLYPKDITKEKMEIPEDYSMRQIQGKDDRMKVHRVLWRGFNHEGEAPVDGIAEREKMQSAPNYRYDLNIVIEAKTGDYVSYSGVWVDLGNKAGYIEPVCTDPDYRNKGLGKLAVLECVKRAQKLGAKNVYIESSNPFYQKIGFEPLFTRYIYKKYF